MNARRLSILLLLTLVFSACQPPPAPDVATATPKPATRVPAATATPVAESSLGVEAAALEGITLDVWHPWYGVPASLFDSQVAEFNSTNTWGILVRATSFQNYTELYEEASAALDDA